MPCTPAHLDPPHPACRLPPLQRVRTTAAMCVLPMLRSPAWQRRIRWAHLTAEQMLLARAPPNSLDAAPNSSGGGGSLSSLGDSSSSGGSGGSDDSFDCRVAVLFFQLLLVCVSLLLAACIEAPRSSAAAAAAAPRQRPNGQASPCGRAAAAVRRGASAAEQFLATLCAVLSGQAFPGVIQLASWLLLLSFLWTLAVVLEQPGLSLPSQLPATAG